MKPVLQALVVADQVYIDQGTGKKVVCGIFHTLAFRPGKPPSIDQPAPVADSPRKPEVRAGSPSAYISLTEIREATVLDLRYVDLEDNSILFSASMALQSDTYDPLASIELVVALPILPIPHKGHYAFELLYNGELIGSHRIQAIELPEETT